MGFISFPAYPNLFEAKSLSYVFVVVVAAEAKVSEKQ